MGEVDASCCGDPEVGGESMCRSLLDSGQKGREILESQKDEDSVGEECERLSASEKGGMLVDVDRVSDGCQSCGHEVLQDERLVQGEVKVAEVAEIACSPCDGNVASGDTEDGLRVLLEERKEVEEGCKGFLGAEEESEHLFVELVPSIETQQIDKEEDCNTGHMGLENGRIAGSDAEAAELMEKVCSSPCDNSGPSMYIGSSLGDSVKERKEVEEGCKGFMGPKEEKRYIVVEQGPSVENVEEHGDGPTDLEIGHLGISAEAPELVEGVCCPPCDSDGSFSERKEAGEGCGNVVVADEDSGHLSLEHGPSSETPKHINEEEQWFFPGPSPLRIPGGDALGNSSGIDVGIESRHISGLYGDDKFSSRCEDALLASPVSVAKCPLIKITRDSPIQADGFCCPPPGVSTDASTNSDDAWMDERCKNLLVLEQEKLACSPCRENMIYSNDGIREEDQLFSSHTIHGLNISVGAHKRQCEVDICGPSEESSVPLEDGCINKDVDRGVSGSRRGLRDKVACFLAMDGSSSQQSSLLSSVAENCPSDPSLAESRENNSDAVNMTSTCCSDAKDSCGQVSDAGTVNQKPAPLIVFRRTNPKRAASSRNSGINEKSDRLTRTRNSVQNGRKAVDASTSISISMIKISKKAARKRSSLHRPPRHSLWGEADNLIRIFRQNDDLASYDFVTSHTRNKRSKKGLYRGGRRKRQTTQTNGNLRLPKDKGVISTKSVHIKDEMYLQPMFPGAGDSQASIQECNSLKILNCRADSDVAIQVSEVEHKLADGQFAIETKSLQHDVQQGDKDLESTLTQETSVENLHGECPGVSSGVGSEATVEPVNNLCLLDPGSSPDSDVYNPVADADVINCEGTTSTSQDAGINQKIDDGLHASVSTSCNAIASPISASSLDRRPRTYTRKGKKGKENFEVSEQACTLLEHPFIKEKLHSPDNLTKAWKSSKLSKPRTKKQDVFSGYSKSFREAARKGLEGRTFPMESSIFGNAEMEYGQESKKMELGSESWALSGQDIETRQSEDGISGNSLVTDQIKGRKVNASSKPVVRKRRPRYPDSARCRRPDIHGQKKGTVWKSENNFKNQERSHALDVCLGESASLSLPSGMMTGSAELSCKINVGRMSGSTMTPVGGESTLNEASHGLEGQSLRKSAAWVSCDDCLKWRCISPALADFIEETKCRWTCKDNADKAFADCLIPQEKTNAEINAELEISGDEDAPSAKPAASQQTSWMHIKSNVFLHRNRKTQTIDEVMICQCKPPLDGSLGCGEDCLNRMLSIECVKGTCPCGDLCSNQQFQKRKYAKLKSYPCGKKGYGLKLLEDVSQGQFLIEYVGEVLDIATYEARQRSYASRGQKHFYFMTLNNSEVIDACAKGNLGRFINHSCDPNCRTEKWMVNGEVCIGLFAIRNIKKDEEVTFDYNYVRVVGAAAKKCACGTSGCKGYIGGDPLNTEVIVQGDSDEEYPEPVMIHERSLKVLDAVETVYDAMDAKVVKYEDMHEEGLLSHSSTAIPGSEACKQIQDTQCRPPSDVSTPDVSSNPLDPMQTEDRMSGPLSDVQLSMNSMLSSDDMIREEIPCRPASDVQPSDVASDVQPSDVSSDVQPSDVSLRISNTLNESRSSKTSVSNAANHKQYASKRYLVAKSSRSSSTIKKSQSSAKNLVPDKPKKLSISAATRHLDGVEQKLNDLLDPDGGISKRKDATKGYLKLLFVTASEGDNIGGCASQSMRDLSLILDALLKTKSRMVLVDIINKNGLQMLHNIMKQNCSKFNRIPIIRKLLKVLEFLALKGILTPEHINKGPPCSGMESFRDSILSLTRHNDMQVHRIARNFRDRWIPRTMRRVEPSARDDGQLDPQRPCNWFQSSLFESRRDHRARDANALISVSKAIDHHTSSRLVDIPDESSLPSSQLVSNSTPLTDNKPTTGTKTRKRKSRWDQPSDIIMFQDQQTPSSVKDQIDEAGSKVLKTSPAQLGPSSEPEFLKQNFEIQRDNSSFDEAASVKNLVHRSSDDEAPPGFGSQMDNPPQVPSRALVATSEVSTGYLQERYLSHLSVSFGIPVALVQQLGTPQVGGNHCEPSWAIAPGMPFQPFPPLPPYPRGEPNPATAMLSSSEHNIVAQGAREPNLTRGCRTEPRRCHAEPHRTDQTAPSPSEERPADMVGARPRNSRMSERIRWPSNNSGRRFFRPRRWNDQRFTTWLPWPRENNDPGFRGSLRNADSTWLPWPQESNDPGLRGSLRDAESTSPPLPRESDDHGFRCTTTNADSSVGIGNEKDIGDLGFSEAVSNDDVCS